MQNASYADSVASGIWDSGVARVGYVPSVSIAPVISSLVRADGGRDGVSDHVTPLSREEEVMGVMGALPLTGQLGAAVIQDNGFGNALTALATFNLAYHLPLLIFANTRGGLGEYNSMIHSISEPMPSVLKSFGLPIFELDRRSCPDDWQAVVTEAGVHSKMTYRPVVVLAHFWGTDSKGA